MNCFNCKLLTSNPKFCSSSCSATYNNKLHPKRHPEGECKSCAKPMLKGLKRELCYKCKPKLVLDLTLDSNKGRNAYVRGNARLVYKKSNRPYACVICFYRKHVNICHIKDIRSYPDGTPYSVVNHESNLIPLCKNHHWEFDNDLL